MIEGAVGAPPTAAYTRCQEASGISRLWWGPVQNSFLVGRERMSEVSTARTVSAAPGELMAPGTRVGKYEVVHRIAFGGMAEIYLARAVGIHGFEKYVVLKRILPQHAANVEFVRMFLKEARVAATLDHANIAHVYEIGETQGNYFFTMEYLHGEDVRWVMHQLSLLGQRLPLEHALEIVVGAASGLHFAHEKSGLGRPLPRDRSPGHLAREPGGHL